MLKTVAEYYNEYEAQIAKGLLESEGIEAVVMNLNSSYPGVQMGRHGIQLQVHDYDLESAQMILENAENAAADETAETDND
ncbi:MAG: DUF2007 domain-containing protein [Bacteroidales bacterium]|nr:DUF2007 domain-containing protein [Bacteroidales bacterium]